MSAGFHPAELAGNLSIQAHVMDWRPEYAKDAAELRALEDRVEAEVRQYRYDLWHEMDADGGERGGTGPGAGGHAPELEEVREAITAERESQGSDHQIIPETSAHLHRLRDDIATIATTTTHHYHHYRVGWRG